MAILARYTVDSVKVDNSKILVSFKESLSKKVIHTYFSDGKFHPTMITTPTIGVAEYIGVIIWEKTDGDQSITAESVRKLVGDQVWYAALDMVTRTGKPEPTFRDNSHSESGNCITIRWCINRRADHGYILHLDVRELFGGNDSVWVRAWLREYNGSFHERLYVNMKDFFERSGYSENTFKHSARWANLHEITNFKLNVNWSVLKNHMFGDGKCNIVFEEIKSLFETSDKSANGVVKKLGDRRDFPIGKPLYTFGCKRFIGENPIKGSVYIADLNRLGSDGKYQRDAYLLIIAKKAYVVPIHTTINMICQAINVNFAEDPKTLKSKRRFVHFQAVQEYFSKVGGLTEKLERAIKEFAESLVFEHYVRKMSATSLMNYSGDRKHIADAIYTGEGKVIGYELYDVTGPNASSSQPGSEKPEFAGIMLSENEKFFVAVNYVYRLFYPPLRILENLTAYCSIGDLEDDAAEELAKHGIDDQFAQVVALEKLLPIFSELPIMGGKGPGPNNTIGYM